MGKFWFLPAIWLLCGVVLAISQIRLAAAKRELEQRMAEAQAALAAAREAQAEQRRVLLDQQRARREELRNLRARALRAAEPDQIEFIRADTGWEIRQMDAGQRRAESLNLAMAERFSGKDIWHRSGSQRRAYDLLRSSLTPDQRETLEKFNFFTVRGSQGGSYTLWPKNSHGVVDNDSGRTGCIVLQGGGDYLPIGDQMLAQKLLAESDEGKFRRTAIWN